MSTSIPSRKLLACYLIFAAWLEGGLFSKLCPQIFLERQIPIYQRVWACDGDSGSNTIRGIYTSLSRTQKNQDLGEDASVSDRWRTKMFNGGKAFRAFQMRRTRQPIDDAVAERQRVRAAWNTTARLRVCEWRSIRCRAEAINIF
jgi:hypothetical protein